MAVVTLDREAARAAIRAAAARFAALVRETDDIGRQAAGTDWTVARQQEIVGHVLALTFADYGAKEKRLRDDPINGSVEVCEEQPREFESRFVDDVRLLGC